jgi:DNA (cytosine-5)-methyltransferase 1
MNYVERINSLLRPKPEGKIHVLDLFAGCGGLALGFEAQGFETLGFEQDADACETYRRNLKSDCKQVTLTTETQFPKADGCIVFAKCFMAQTEVVPAGGFGMWSQRFMILDNCYCI